TALRLCRGIHWLFGFGSTSEATDKILSCSPAHDANLPAYHHQQPRLDGLLLVKGFMELTFGVSVSGGRAGGRAELWRVVIFLGDTTGERAGDKNIKSDQTTLWPYPPVRTVPVGVGAAHVAPLMRGDLAGPQMKQSGAASTSERDESSSRRRCRLARARADPDLCVLRLGEGPQLT
ncbi:hypothetical protein THAOC_07273, partial [Thalassiosira oceanica]